MVDQIKQGNIPEWLEEIIGMNSEAPNKVKMLFGTLEHTEKGVKTGEVSKLWNFKRHKALAFCPYKISDSCCEVMKKRPMHKYQKETGRMPMTAQMASESKLRTRQWLANGCNGFEMKSPISNPMAFWTEQDVLFFLKTNNIKIASVYGDIIKAKEIDYQMDFDDFGIEGMGFQALKTTGCRRTGCMFCGFGCHMEAPGEGRFERLKVTHPKQYEYIMKPWIEGGLEYKTVIDWINKYDDLDIRY